VRALKTERPLGELCEFQRGLTYGKSDEVALSESVVLRANNIELATNSLDFSELRYIAPSVQVPESKRVRAGALLICTASGSKSHLGKVAYVDADYGYAFGGFMGQLVPAQGVEGRYLFHALTSPRYKSFIDELSDGLNINNLKFDDLRRFQIPMPGVEAQRRIVAILDEAFEGIATAKALAEKNLRNAREWSARQLSNALEAAAAGGRSDTLERMVASSCSLSYGIVQPGDEVSGGLPVVRPVDLGAKVVHVKGLKRIDPALARSYLRTTLEGNDLLLCVRGTTGTVSIADPALAGANVTRGIVPIRFDPLVVSQRLGYYLLRSEPMQAQIRAKTYGTALMQINISDLRKIVVALPPLQEQAALIERLDAIQEAADQLVDVCERKLAALDELKQSLLHQAFSGAL
jgi:type I restriction enzyme S subunit